MAEVGWAVSALGWIRRRSPPGSSRGLGVHRLQRIREAAGPGPDYPADGAVDGAG